MDQVNTLQRIEERINAAPKWLTIVVSHLALYGLYAATNRSPLRSPSSVPFLPGEERLPAIGWTSWFYLSLLIELPLAMALLPRPGYGRTVMIGVAVVIFHILIFTCFPTSYPRPSESSGSWMIDQIWKVDQPGNCFPSLHVAMAFFLALAVWRTNGRKLGGALLLWAILVAGSTVTVKQHYLLDSAAAIAIALIAVNWVPRRKGGKSA